MLKLAMVLAAAIGIMGATATEARKDGGHPEECCCAYPDGSHAVVDHEACEDAGGECHDMEHCEDANGVDAPCRRGRSGTQEQHQE